MNKGLKCNDVMIAIQKLPNKKLPALTVHIGIDIYKVATFKDEKTANWFEEICEEFFNGYVEKERK